jgi:peroxiredoxin
MPLNKPTVLVFFRGKWCPFCRWELAGLKTIVASVTACGGEIIAVSPDRPAENAELCQRLQLPFSILADPNLAVTDAFGLRHTGGRLTTGEDKPFPTTFVLDARGTVAARLENETYRHRPQPQEVLSALKEAAGAEARK